MKATYDFTVKSVGETITVVTVDGKDINVPIISDRYEPELKPEMTTEQKNAIKDEARKQFKITLKGYLKDYFAGIDAVTAPTISATIKNLETKTFTFTVSDIKAG